MFLRQLGIRYEGPAVPLEADPSFWSATKEEIDAVAQGCGPGKYGDYIIPDSVTKYPGGILKLAHELYAYGKNAPILK